MMIGLIVLAVALVVLIWRKVKNYVEDDFDKGLY